MGQDFGESFQIDNNFVARTLTSVCVTSRPSHQILSFCYFINSLNLEILVMNEKEIQLSAFLGHKWNCGIESIN